MAFAKSKDIEWIHIRAKFESVCEEDLFIRKDAIDWIKEDLAGGQFRHTAIKAGDNLFRAKIRSTHIIEALYQ